jgi:hypothetical protein
VQVVVQEADKINPFLWADIIIRKDKVEKKGNQKVREQGVGDQAGSHNPESRNKDLYVDEEGEENKNHSEFDFTTMHQNAK